jgi:hypothetical protein
MKYKFRAPDPDPRQWRLQRELSQAELEALARDGSWKQEHFLIQILAENLLKEEAAGKK